MICKSAWSAKHLPNYDGSSYIGTQSRTVPNTAATITSVVTASRKARYWDDMATCVSATVMCSELYICSARDLPTSTEGQWRGGMKFVWCPGGGGFFLFFAANRGIYLGRLVMSDRGASPELRVVSVRPVPRCVKPTTVWQINQLQRTSAVEREAGWARTNRASTLCNPPSPGVQCWLWLSNRPCILSKSQPLGGCMAVGRRST